MLTLTNNRLFSLAIKRNLLALHCSAEAGLAVLQMGPIIIEVRYRR